MLSEECIETAIAQAKRLWDPQQRHKSIRKFFFVLAVPHPGATADQYFSYKRQYEVDLEVAAREGWDSLEAAMRDLGNQLRRRVLLQRNV